MTSDELNFLQYEDEKKWSYVSGIQCAAAIQREMVRREAQVQQHEWYDTLTSCKVNLNKIVTKVQCQLVKFLFFGA